MSAERDLISVIEEMTQKKTAAYDTQAVVTKVEGDTAWVHIAGGVDETPIQRTINCKVGDSVQVRVSGGRGWITGNTSAPPTDDAVANVADEKAVNATNIATEAGENAMSALLASESAQNSARQAEQAAGEAQASAESASQAASDAWDKASDAETAASTAQSRANDAYTAASNAQTSADSAQASAHNANEYASRALGNLTTVQSVAETLTWITQHGTMALTSDTSIDPTHVYFVVDANGDYVVGSTHYSIVTEPETSALNTYYELTIDESLNNYVGTHLALTSEGLWLLPAASGTNKVLIATGAGTTYTVAGTYIVDNNGDVVASFSASGVTIGKNLSGQSRTEVYTNGMQIVQNVNGADVEIATLGYGPTYNGQDVANAPFYTLGKRATTTMLYNPSSTYTVGDLCVQNTMYGNRIFVCVESISTPEAWNPNHWHYYAGGYSLVEGTNNVACDIGAHAEGQQTRALEMCAHAEGSLTYAIEEDSHAEGTNTYAYGKRSHAEGMSTTARGDQSHAGGTGAQARGENSFSHGFYTVSYSDNQIAIGKANRQDFYDTYAFIIGNGSGMSSRSNAFTVDWSGNVDIPNGAKYKVNGADLSASDVGAVPTSRTVNGHALSSNVTVSASDVGAVPTSRMVNGKALSSDISLTASDVGAISTETDPTVPSWAKASTKPTYTASEVGALPDTTSIPSSLSDLTNDKLASSLFVVEKVSTGISISATTGGASGNKAYTKTGYTCLGVVGYDCQGTGVTQCNVYRLYWDGSKAHAYVRTAQSTTITVYPYLLWLKTS